MTGQTLEYAGLMHSHIACMLLVVPAFLLGSMLLALGWFLGTFLVGFAILAPLLASLSVAVIGW